MTTAVPEVASPEPRAVSDIAAWLVALLPLTAVAVEVILQKDLLIFVLALNVALCGWDELLLKEAGYRRLSTWIFLIPIYLWKRAALLRRPPVHFWVWIVSFAASLLLPGLLRPNTTRQVACELVTEILREQDSVAPACKGVTITNDPGTGFVKAKALLSDGTERHITIEEMGDSIQVQVLPK